ncbi:RNA-binding domain-containing protein [Clostridium sp.]|uniref:RNA-binding domain-containing protein n=1 Tax=Clostridium sp. TaxID=1506 RepID=UPI002617B01B|nr:RNA-binding domain-containing protein [Clostridium sp.]
MLVNELLEVVNNGENFYIEFKEEQIKSKDLGEEIVAFANSEGGTILIGVSDDKRILGVDDSKIEEKIMNICRNNVIPNIVPNFEIVNIDSKKIVVLTIPKGLSKPYSTVDNKYYIRVGTTKRIASREELLRLFEGNGSLHFDISPVPNSSIKDLNLDIIRDYFLKYNAFDLAEEDSKQVKRILINADILKPLNDDIVCSVGGLLVFGKFPQNTLPQNGVSFAHFKGNDISNELIDKKVIEGRIQDIAEQTMVVIRNNIRVPSKINSLKREDIEIYPLIVLREAIVNCLVHRNYSIYGSKIRIFMFDDRIEFRSPGRLPNTVTVEKMKIGVSFARNPFLVKYMENMRYIDQLGRGIPMIIKNMTAISNKEPQLTEIGEEFILTIYNNL